MVNILKKIILTSIFLILVGAGCDRKAPYLLSTNKTIEKVETLQLLTTSTISELDLAVASSTVAELKKHIFRTQVTDWKMPTSSQRGVPLDMKNISGSAREEAFSIYNFDLDKLTVIGRNIVGANQEPFVAPNFLFTAYINNNQSLYVISNDNFKKSLIYQGSENSPVSLIGWSPDSTKLFFSTAIRDGEDAGGPVYKLASFKILNIVDGSIISLTAGMDVVLNKFIDNKRVLVEVYVKDHSVTSALNLDTMQLDQNWYEEKFGLMSAVFHKNWASLYFEGSLSADGRKFAGNKSELGNEEYALSVPGRADKSYSSVIYGDNKNKTAIVLAKGKWAQYQRVLISPSGDKVVYEEEELQEFFNQNQTRTNFWMYDDTTGKRRLYKFEDDAKVIQWLDNNKLLFYTRSPFSATPSFLDAYNVLDTVTGVVTKVWGRETSALSIRLKYVPAPGNSVCLIFRQPHYAGIKMAPVGSAGKEHASEVYLSPPVVGELVAYESSKDCEGWVRDILPPDNLGILVGGTTLTKCTSRTDDPARLAQTFSFDANGKVTDKGVKPCLLITDSSMSKVEGGIVIPSPPNVAPPSPSPLSPSRLNPSR